MKRSLKLTAVLLLMFSFFNISAPRAYAENISGDLDGDGVVTTADARIALRYAAAMDKPKAAQKALADMNGDGSVTIEDVKLILKSAVDVEGFEESLIDAGFPISYVEYLVELYRKYPQWEFVPMHTGIDWQDAVDGERDPHKKQLIENVVQASYKCSCSSCDGVIQEASNWVSASEEAVKYYMDPRNFLTEEYIFQFESTAYDKTQTIEGVEAILKGTWMEDSVITYINALGTEKTYKVDGVAPKYSEVIMDAAKDSGMSAYYLASKIVQEVGSSSASNAGGSSGENAPYNGIYNYYNIGAYTGVRDGLEWANGFMKTIRSTVMYKSASTDASKVVTIPSNTEVYYIGASGDFYRVSTIVGGTTYKGYVKKDNISAYTSYGRPWNTPQKTIYYGAKYIYESFSEYQYTSYLQKFNVNPESPSLHGHEYMANVRAAAFESKKTYNAYASANILENKKVFCIPVFENMPGADLTMEDRFKAASPEVYCSDYTLEDATLSWNAIEGAVKYQVHCYNAEEGKYERVKITADTTYTVENLSAGETAKYKVRGYKTNEEGETVFTSYSNAYTVALKPSQPQGIAVASKGDSSVKIKWTAADGLNYAVYRYDAYSGAYAKIGTTANAYYTDKTVDSGTAYKYKIKAYKTTSSASFYSAFSSVVSVTTTGEATAKSGTVKISDGFLNLRSEANTSSSILAELENGTSVKILATSGAWYKVSVTVGGESLTGYVHSDYIKLTEQDNTQQVECPYTEPTATVREGDSGESVRWVQWYLYKLGYLTEGDIDGSFGPTTLSAVLSFQTDAGIDVDGLVGAGTRAALKSA